jgi:hypothetical protein
MNLLFFSLPIVVNCSSNSPAPTSNLSFKRILRKILPVHSSNIRMKRYTAKFEKASQPVRFDQLCG